MHAFAVRNFGEAPAIHDLPIPAADGAFLIRVRYAGVNPIDYKLLERLTATSTYPFVMGIDFAGGSNEFRQGRPILRRRPYLRDGTDTRRVRRVHRGRTGCEDRTAGAYPRRSH